MAEGTRQSLLSEIVSMLKEETAHPRKEQDKQKLMLEAMLQQLNSLANSYEQLAIHKNSQNGGNGGEGSSNTKGQFFANPMFEGNGGIKARTLRLDFPNLMGRNQWIGSLRLNNSVIIFALLMIKN